jgi:hypothetical protein
MSKTYELQKDYLSTHRKNYFEWIKQIISASLAVMAFLAAFKVSDSIENSWLYPIFMAIDQVILMSSVFTGLYAMSANWTVLLEQANKANKAIHEYGYDRVDDAVANMGGLISKPTIGQDRCARACWKLFAVGFILVVVLSITSANFASKSKLDSESSVTVSGRYHPESPASFCPNIHLPRRGTGGGVLRACANEIAIYL